VLAEYLTGTVFGAVFIAIFAGFIASLGIFNPLALAMGSGVGSGSMMAAASGAIAAQQTPEMAKSVLTFAAASNLITTTIGTYFTLFISLPMAVWGYRLLEPLIGRTSKASSASTASESGPTLGEVKTQAPELRYGGKIMAWCVTAVMALVADWITHGTTPMQGLPGMAIMVFATIAGDALAQLTGRKIPAVCWVSIAAMFLTSPACPWGTEIAALSARNDFLGVTTPMLTFAGLSIAKDIPAFRKLGWRIVLVSFVSNAGTFIGASIIAQIFHI
jgi:hypothetical protein